MGICAALCLHAALALKADGLGGLGMPRTDPVDREQHGGARRPCGSKALAFSPGLGGLRGG
eukprot:CAMPEP_0206271098 /NCGR_PEP_ID=MMETSP0047_2-20121206/33240_1 /ASSEMBLY_ACC=CAM_ASM_000192 /TAXON_ID=195065 /ORGANISM="Chroomonas mesostigmatica_cf, Strain CCMP1168" /LENGTH=60 /DNA_ID=CAMNT_0053699823 /DNA_START=79 /DNA_END=257 /DNA_ORIENTATION=-